MTSSMRGPGIFLAQFAADTAPFNSLASIAGWAATLGYAGVQIPSWDRRLFDLDRAADSDAYRDEVKGTLAQAGVALTELSTHLQGQLVAVHPAYDEAFDGFAPEAVRGNREARQAWAVDQLIKAARASARFGLTAHATFSGALAWPYIYPWPQRPPGSSRQHRHVGRALVADPDAFDASGVDVCFEIHPVKICMTAPASRCSSPVSAIIRVASPLRPEPFRAAAARLPGLHRPVHDRIGAFHVKDAEFNPTARQGVYGGYQSWVDRAGKFRSLGDGQVNFSGIFSKLAQVRVRRLGGPGVGMRNKVS